MDEETFLQKLCTYRKVREWDDMIEVEERKPVSSEGKIALCDDPVPTMQGCSIEERVLAILVGLLGEALGRKVEKQFWTALNRRIAGMDYEALNGFCAPLE